MARTTWVDRRLDGMKTITPLRIAINVTAVAKSVFIVQTILIRVPQIKQHMRYGLARARQDATLERDRLPVGLRMDEIHTLGRMWREIRPRDGRYCRLCLVLVSTCRCEWSVSGEQQLRPNPQRAQCSERESALHGGAAGPWSIIRHGSILVGQAGACNQDPSEVDIHRGLRDVSVALIIHIRRWID